MVNQLFNLEAVECKMLNYFTQAQEAAEKYCKHKHDTNTININFVELSKQAVKEHKDIHRLVASKMFDVKYEDVTNEQRRAAVDLLLLEPEEKQAAWNLYLACGNRGLVKTFTANEMEEDNG